MTDAADENRTKKSRSSSHPCRGSTPWISDAPRRAVRRRPAEALLHVDRACQMQDSTKWGKVAALVVVEKLDDGGLVRDVESHRADGGSQCLDRADGFYDFCER